jgi:hypothetical protein
MAINDGAAINTQSDYCKASAFGTATLVNLRTTLFDQINQQILAQKSIKWPPSQGAAGRS